MRNQNCINDALREIQNAYNREIKMWYRIHRKALKKGLSALAMEIALEIRASQQEMSSLQFADWDQKKYLFQIR